MFSHERSWLFEYFLGVEVAHGPDGFVLCQRKYALDIISEEGLLGVRPAAIPLEQNYRLALSTSKELNDPECTVAWWGG